MNCKRRRRRRSCCLLFCSSFTRKETKKKFLFFPFVAQSYCSEMKWNEWHSPVVVLRSLIPNWDVKKDEAAHSSVCLFPLPPGPPLVRPPHCTECRWFSLLFLIQPFDFPLSIGCAAAAAVAKNSLLLLLLLLLLLFLLTLWHGPTHSQRVHRLIKERKEQLEEWVAVKVHSAAAYTHTHPCKNSFWLPIVWHKVPSSLLFFSPCHP